MVKFLRSLLNFRARPNSIAYSPHFSISPLEKFFKRRDQKKSNKEIREKARWIADEVEYGVNFIRICGNKVVGPRGMLLDVKNEKNEIDEHLLKLVVEDWKDYCSMEYCEVTGNFSMRHIEKMIIRTLAVDGEIFIIKLKGYQNKYRFTLQLLDADMLDENLYRKLNNGNTIKAGIEVNSFGKAEGYWFYKGTDENVISSQFDFSKYERFDAKDVIHLVIKTDLKQVRGRSWFSSVIERLNVLYDYCDLELASSKLEASKKTWLINKDKMGTNLRGDEVDSAGNKILNAEVGDHRILKGDWDVKDENLQHPNKSFAAFVVTILRSVAAGLGVSYNNLASDLERVNYSSLRSGLLEEIEYSGPIGQNVFSRFIVTPNSSIFS